MCDTERERTHRLSSPLISAVWVSPRFVTVEHSFLIVGVASPSQTQDRHPSVAKVLGLLVISHKPHYSASERASDPGDEEGDLQTDDCTSPCTIFFFNLFSPRFFSFNLSFWIEASCDCSGLCRSWSLSATHFILILLELFTLFKENSTERNQLM